MAMEELLENLLVACGQPDQQELIRRRFRQPSGHE
jgi:hypothetical protein